jgi:hypothetical protein
MIFLQPAEGAQSKQGSNQGQGRVSFDGQILSLGPNDRLGETKLSRSSSWGGPSESCCGDSESTRPVWRELQIPRSSPSWLSGVAAAWPHGPGRVCTRLGSESEPEPPARGRAASCRQCL